MFESFSKRARKAMALANQEAQRSWSDYILSEHILIALLRLDARVGARVLGSFRIDLKRVRGPEDRLAHGRTNQVVELAIEESRALGQTYVGTEHLLLGLIRHSEGLAGE